MIAVCESDIAHTFLIPRLNCLQTLFKSWGKLFQNRPRNLDTFYLLVYKSSFHLQNLPLTGLKIGQKRPVIKVRAAQNDWSKLRYMKAPSSQNDAFAFYLRMN